MRKASNQSNSPSLNLSVNKLRLENLVSVPKILSRKVRALFSDIQSNTPIESGNLLASWYIEIDGEKYSEPPDEDAYKNFRNGMRIKIANSAPYAKFIEFGLYDLLGKDKSSTVDPKKTNAEGYSTNSPHGMIRPAVMRNLK